MAIYNTSKSKGYFATTHTPLLINPLSPTRYIILSPAYYSGYTPLSAPPAVGCLQYSWPPPTLPRLWNRGTISFVHSYAYTYSFSALLPPLYSTIYYNGHPINTVPTISLKAEWGGVLKFTTNPVRGLRSYC